VKNRLSVLLAVAACLCKGAPESVPCRIRLTDVTAQTGITFVHTDGSSGRRYIVETVCCGLALFDYDRDGDIDIYFVNGAPLPGATFKTAPRNELWRNDGDWRFTNVTEEAGVGDTGYGLGVCVGDYDNDGWPDIFVNNFGPNVLYRNNGDGSFTDVTDRAGVRGGNMVGAGACFLDMDGDGDLDLYVSNYVDFTFEKHRICRFNGYPAYVGPLDYEPTCDFLYRNNGDGTFTEVGASSGISAHRGTGMGMVCGDFDRDGDTDIYVGNDEMGNFLFLNNGGGKFEEGGLFLGVAYDFGGKPQGTMAAECGDIDNDGYLDIYATSYQQEFATLYRNLGGDLFEDVTRTTGAGAGTFPYVTWGTGLVDFDNDGDRDIFVACGHLHDNVELFDNSTSYKAANIVLENMLRETGNLRFRNVSDRCGNGLKVKESSRGAAFDDLDNDGDVDVVVLNSRRPPTILRNDTPAGNHWIEIELRGVRSNRDGVGAQVELWAGDLHLLDELHSGRSYQSDFGKRLYFGLGARDRADRLEIRWVGGGRELIRNVKGDRIVRIVEGTGKAVEVKVKKQ